MSLALRAVCGIWFPYLGPGFSMQAGYDTGLSVTDASNNKYHCKILPIFALKEHGLVFSKPSVWIPTFLVIVSLKPLNQYFIPPSCDPSCED